MFRLIASTATRRSTSILSARPSISPQSSCFRALFSDYAGGDGSSDKIKGTVKWFDAKKGFGFIVPSDGSPDLFVHHSSIHASGFRSLGDGEEVEFEVVTEPNGKSKAINVSGPDGAYVQGAPRRDDGYYGGGGGGYGGGGGGGYNDGGGYGGGGGY